MIPFNKIDTLFDTQEKRYQWVIGIYLLYWLWQCIWLLIFFVQLFQVDDYERLFDFYRHLNQYNMSVWVRMLYSLLLQSRFTISMVDFLCIMGTGIWLLKHWKWAIGIGAYVFYLAVALVSCLQVSSIGQLILKFHHIAFLSILFHGGIILCILYYFIEMFMDNMINK